MSLKKVTSLLFCCLLVIIACNKDDDEPTTPEAVKATNLIYSPNEISLEDTKGGSSATPSVSGTAPITYSVAAISPTTSKITINATTGVISAIAGLDAGTYTIDVKATNAAGDATFTGVYFV